MQDEKARGAARPAETPTVAVGFKLTMSTRAIAVEQFASARVAIVATRVWRRLRPAAVLVDPADGEPIP